MRFTKALILDRLVTELQVAGVQVTRLGSHLVGAETEVYTYDSAGVQAELPEAARPVIEAHDGRTEEEANPLDYGIDKVPTRPQLVAGIATIQAYLDNPSPTQANTVTAFKLICKALLFVMRRLGL